MLNASTASDQAIAALEEGRLAEEERARLRAFRERFLIYSDHYEDLVKARVAAVFSDPEKAKRIGVIGDSSFNVFKKVVDETYQYRGAKRAFTRGGASDEVYARVQRAARTDIVMGECSIVMGGFNDGLVSCIPGPQDEAGEPLGLPVTRVFFPHEVVIEEDPRDPSQPIEVRYLKDSGRGPCWVVWTKDHHYLENEKGIITPARADGDLSNPYGRLPFVALHDGLRPDCFWDTLSGTDLVAFTQDILRDLATLAFTQLQQSHLQLVVRGVAEDWPGFATQGVGTIFPVAANVNVDVVNMQADLSRIVEAIKFRLTLKLQEYGINAEKFLNPGQAPMSGVARRVERDDLLERRRRLRPFMEDVETQYAELFRWAYNWNRGRDRIAEDATFEVEVFEEQVVQSPEEIEETLKIRLERFKLERELGVSDEVEQLAEYRGISLEAAKQVLASRAPALAPPTEAQEAPEE